MSERLLTQLTQKVRQTAQEIQALKKERGLLLSEMELMKEENRRARRLAREHTELVGEREKTRNRLEQLLEKLARLKV